MLKDGEPETGNWADAHRLELLLDQINRQYKRTFASRLRSTSLTSEQALVVAALTYYGPMTQRELGVVLHRHKAAVSAAINNMAREKFVERTVKPSDNRSNVVSLLPRGLEAFSTVDGLVSEFRTRLTQGLSAGEYDDLVRILQVLQANLETFACELQVSDADDPDDDSDRESV